MTDTQNSTINELVTAWKTYFETVDNWQKLVTGIEPKTTGCGPVYELENKLNRPNESLAIADMRGIEYATPHYHANGETEVYFALEGAGLVVVGSEETQSKKGSVIVIPPDTAHYAIPDKVQGLILAVVNTPPFSIANNIDLADDNPEVNFDLNMFKQLTNQNGEEAIL